MTISTTTIGAYPKPDYVPIGVQLRLYLQRIGKYSKEKKMEVLEDRSHAFIVRYWLEPREIRGEKPLWRGVIEHVSSGRKLYLKGLNEITAFIGYYLPGIDKIH